MVIRSLCRVVARLFGREHNNRLLCGALFRYVRQDIAMPLPDEANTITGGCSCGAIRYRIAIPPLESRHFSPMAPPSENSRLPQVMTCHCNDCRRATSTFLAIAVIDLSAPMLTVSAMSPTSESTIASGRMLDVMAEGYDVQKADSERPPYLPAMDVLRATDESKSWVRFFHSATCGPEFSRSFCGRCGTHLCYHLKLQPEWCHNGKLPEDWQDSFHIYLGSIDREFLDEDWLVPSIELNFKYGTHFTKTTSATAVGLRHVPKVMGLSEEEGIVEEEELTRFRA
ncbi:hypothetical protein B0T10DRAFT_500189 [Thelonectria olida]|uniref:CENP-V/GFA domain-containing protein n=1 Tax=Thelonectria olida TaxID=1576542 RepID=A0A9P9AKL6_9HYPO|nr:hypothetical protein B0T10DRAFT_500189 [Thelonectria olida]